MQRNVSALLLTLPERGEQWLFDCGEATQHQLLRYGLSSGQLSRVFITHLHGDHLYGLPGLLASRGLAGTATPLALYGPPGLARYLAEVLAASHTWLGYEPRVEEVESGQIVDDPAFTVRCLPLDHRVPAIGYRVDERPRPGHFDVAGAAALGLPPGPLYGQLKQGQTVRLADGRLIDGAALIGPPEAGRSLAYCTDTRPCPAGQELAHEVDLLVHEATFAECDAELASATWHSTAAEAAGVARAAGARRLLLTHLSARYQRGGVVDEAQLLAEARAVFPTAELAQDGLSLELPRHRPPLDAAAAPRQTSG